MEVAANDVFITICSTPNFSLIVARSAPKISAAIGSGIILAVILVTGGTGFIGRHLVRSLVDSGQDVRILLRPSTKSPTFPKGVPVEVTISSLNDIQGMKAALKGIHEVYHLAGAERKGTSADLNKVDVEGTIALVTAAKQSKIERIFFVSHIGANRASAYPVLKAKGLAENWIMNCGIPYTIIRTGVVFGPGDQFTEPIARLLKLFTPLFLIAGNGDSLLQPIWIDDLIQSLSLINRDPKMINKIIMVGGIEALQYREIVKLILKQLNLKRMVVSISPAYLRALSLWVNQLFPKFPISIFWLDYLADDRTTNIDSLPRQFGIMPNRFHQNLDYLKNIIQER
jgi:NADH dehydrogenase